MSPGPERIRLPAQDDALPPHQPSTHPPPTHPPIHRNASIHEPWRLTTTDFVSWSHPERIRLPAQDDARSVIDLFPLFSWPPAPPTSSSPATTDHPTAAATTTTAATAAATADADADAAAAPGSAAQNRTDQNSAANGGRRHPHTLIYKLEDNQCESRQYQIGTAVRPLGCTLVLRQASAPTPFGPWEDAGAVGEFFTDAISRPCCEGAALVPAPDGGWILLFDQYREDCFLLGRSSARAEGGGGGQGGGLLLGGVAETGAGDGAGSPECETIIGRPISALGLMEVTTGDSVTGGQSEAANTAGEPQDEANTGGEPRCAYKPARKGIGALASADLRTWLDVTGNVRVPVGYKHGTAVKLDAVALEAVCGGRWGQGPFAVTRLCTAPAEKARAPPRAGREGLRGAGKGRGGKGGGGRGGGGGKARAGRGGGNSSSAAHKGSRESK